MFEVRYEISLGDCFQRVFTYLWNFSEASSDFVLWISSSLITDSERRVRSCSIIDNLHNSHTVILEEGMPYSA